MLDPKKAIKIVKEYFPSGSRKMYYFNCLNCKKEIKYDYNLLKRVSGYCRKCAPSFLIKKPIDDKTERKCSICGEVLSIENFCKRDSGHRKYSCTKCNNLRKFGLSRKDYQILFEKQNGECLICNKKSKLVVDHCHETGKIRGLLCSKCNCALGSFKDDITSLKNGINYLKKNYYSSHEIDVKFKKLNKDSIEPFRNTKGDAGWDLFVNRIEDCGNFIKVYSGIAIEPQFGYYFFLVPRSSIYKKGLTLYNNIGIIDNNFRGEIIGIFKKTNDFKELPKIGDRLMQIVPQEQIEVQFTVVDELSDTDRGSGGFGSSGN